MFNKFVKVIAGMHICLFLFIGCQSIYKNYEDGINKVEILIQKSKWDEASSELKQMQNKYKRKHQWKDFYIEPEDLTTLIGFIGELDGAIQQQDGKQAMIKISAIKFMLKEVYYQ